MKRQVINIPQFAFSCLVLTAVWWAAATRLYLWLSPPSLENLSARSFDKMLQNSLLMTALALPWLIRLLASRLRNSLSLYGLAMGAAVGIIALEARYTSCPWLLLSFGLLTAYAWFQGDHTWEADTAERDAASRKVWFYICTTLLSIGILYASIQRLSILYINLYEDAEKMASANAFLLGQTPFRDFVVHYGVLQEIVRPVLAFHIWGTTYEAYQRSGFWLSSFGVMSLFWISAQTLRRKWLAILVGFILLWRSDLVMPDRVLFSILTIFFICRGFITGQRVWMTLAGVFAAASLLYSFEIGFTVFLGVSTYFVVTRRISNGLAPWGAGLLLSFGFLGLYTAQTASTVPFLRDLRELLFYRTATWANGQHSHLFSFHPFVNGSEFHTFLYIHHVPVLCMAVAAYLLLRSETGGVSVRWHAALLLALVIFFQFFVYMGRSDFSHWCNSSFLLIPLISLVMEEILDWLKRPRGYGLVNKPIAALFATALGFPLMLVMWGRQPLLAFLCNGFPHRLVQTQPATPANIPLPERWSRNSPQLSEVAEITQEIRSVVPPNGYFFDFSDCGVFYFLSARRNPTRIGMVEVIQGDRMRTECLQGLAHHPPQIVLARGSPDHLQCRSDLVSIRDYILQHYKVRNQIGPWVFFVPK